MELLNKTIVRMVQLMPKPIVKQFAGNYIAGESLEDGVSVVKLLNSKGILATTDVLGEFVDSKEMAIGAKNDVIDSIVAIHKHNLDSTISIKLTQLGLGIDYEFCIDQVLEIVDNANKNNIFVRIDMEDSPYTQKTINIYKTLKKQYSKVGIVIQAYLKRSYEDILELNKISANYRIVKGIYKEHESIAYKEKQKIRDNFLLLVDEAIKAGCYTAIATHDDFLIDKTYEIIRSKALDKSFYEFQMLLGVRERLRDKILSDGHKIRVYVPFGKDWYGYSIRRFKENPDVAWHVTKSILGINK